MTLLRGREGYVRYKIVHYIDDSYRLPYYIVWWSR